MKVKTASVSISLLSKRFYVFFSFSLLLGIVTFLIKKPRKLQGEIFVKAHCRYSKVKSQAEFQSQRESSNSQTLLKLLLDVTGSSNSTCL